LCSPVSAMKLPMSVQCSSCGSTGGGGSLVLAAVNLGLASSWNPARAFAGSCGGKLRFGFFVESGESFCRSLAVPSVRRRQLEMRF
jgi:hypothetical protein